MYCIRCSMVCKIVFCFEFPDNLDKAGRKARRRRRTQAITKRYAFHAKSNTKINQFLANGLTLYPLKTTEYQRFSGVSRGYKTRTLARKGLRSGKDQNIWSSFDFTHLFLNNSDIFLFMIFILLTLNLFYAWKMFAW